MTPVCKLETKRERHHSKPFKYKRYVSLLTLPTPKSGIIIKMKNTGKIMLQKVLNDVRIIAQYINITFYQQEVYYSYFCWKYIMAIKQVSQRERKLYLKAKWESKNTGRLKIGKTFHIIKTQLKTNVLGALILISLCLMFSMYQAK